MGRGAQQFAEASQFSGLEHLTTEFRDLRCMPQAGYFQLPMQRGDLVDAGRRYSAERGVRRLRRRAR